MSETIVKVGNESGGSVGNWTYVGTITKINAVASGTFISGCYVVLPDAAKELYVIVDPVKSGFTADTWLMSAVIPILSFEDTGVIYYGGFKQGCFGVRLNYQQNPVKNKKSIVIWNIYDRNGTGLSDGTNCEGKVYYR